MYIYEPMCICTVYVHIYVSNCVPLHTYLCRLLRLAVQFLHSSVLSDEEERGLMREKIYANVLDYFWWVQ